MKKILLATLAASIATFSASAAHAESAHGPFYVQANPVGVGVLFYPGQSANGISVGGGSLAAYKLDVEFGYHFSGRHDGFVASLRQAFFLRDGSLGTTTARLGWDMALPLGDGELELVIAPYAHAGVGYAFSGGDPFFHFGFGANGRMFFSKSLGLFAAVTPIEVDFFVGNGTTLPALGFDAGAGFAF